MPSDPHKIRTIDFLEGRKLLFCHNFATIKLRFKSQPAEIKAVVR